MTDEIVGTGGTTESVPLISGGGMGASELPEAGGIAFCELYGTKEGNMVKINLTARSTSPQGALDSLLQTLNYASENYNLHPYMPKKQNPQPPATQSAPAPAPTPTSTEPVYTPVDGGVVRAERMTATPRADGKVKLDFFEPGHQYPDISAVMAPEGLVQLLSGVGAWTVDHFKAICEYETAYDIEWVPSQNLNRSGKPYKNISNVKARA